MLESKSEANMMAPSVVTQWLAPEVNPAEPEMRKDDLSPEQVSFLPRKCPYFPEISPVPSPALTTDTTAIYTN